VILKTREPLTPTDGDAMTSGRALSVDAMPAASVPFCGAGARSALELMSWWWMSSDRRSKRPRLPRPWEVVALLSST